MRRSCFHKEVVGRIEPVERVEVREQGVTVGAWDITVCRDYHGIAGYQQNLPPGQFRRKPPKSTDKPAKPPTDNL